jgi:putative addiction module component (TIGR02574 family)
MANIEDIAAQALTLEMKDRAKLAERLLLSLDELSKAEIELLWADEAERRLKAYRGGDSRAVPADRVFKRAQALVR